MQINAKWRGEGHGAQSKFEDVPWPAKCRMTLLLVMAAVMLALMAAAMMMR